MKKSVYAYLNFSSELPVGRQRWFVPKLDGFTTLNLHPKVEEPGNYVCEDGSIIDSDAVCDRIYDCLTKEDENIHNCQKVKFSSLYKQREPKEMNITFEIVDILGINEYKFSFDIVLRTTISWFDERLNFKYLSKLDNNYLSKVEKDNIWFPEFTFNHVQDDFGSNPIIKPRIIRSSSARMSSSINNIETEEIYSGKETPIAMSFTERKKFFCSFEKFSAYPFQDQDCSFTFQLEGAARINTNLSGFLHTEYEVQKSIGRYHDAGWKLQKIVEAKRQKLMVSVTLTRSLPGILMVTFLPSLVMNLINLATIYLNFDGKYEVIITVNITSLVVLAQIYVGVSADLPSTPQIKPVEIWLLFNFVVPSFVILEAILMQVSPVAFTIASTIKFSFHLPGFGS